MWYKRNFSQHMFAFNIPLLSKKKNIIVQRELLNERFKFSVKNQKDVGLLLKLLEKWLTYKIRFLMVFNCFLFFLSKKKHLHCLRELLSERWKFSMKNQKNVRLLLKLLEKWLAYKIRKFWMVFNCFLILLNPCRKNGKTWFWRFQKFHKLSTSIIREPQGQKKKLLFSEMRVTRKIFTRAPTNLFF